MKKAIGTIAGALAVLCSASLGPGPWAQSRGADPPVISYAADGVGGDETLLLCGDGFDKPGLEIQRWLPPQPTAQEWANEAVQRASLERALTGEAKWPARPEGRPSKLAVSDITRHTCAARLPVGGQAAVQALYLRTAEGVAASWTINRPKLWWTSPEFPAPGARVRVFGRNLNVRYGSGRAAWLRDPQGGLRKVDFGLPFGATGYDGMLTTP